MTASNYADIIRANLQTAFKLDTAELAARLKAESIANELVFKAFGEDCRLRCDGVRLRGRSEEGARGVIISLLARYASAENGIEAPWRAFRELPDSMPYVGAFRAHAELPLVPHVEGIVARASRLAAAVGGRVVAQPVSGDCALVLNPLPKISLCYLFYRPDEEFPANVTCLFAANADHFLPTDALADVGEYTSRALIAAVGGGLR